MTRKKSKDRFISFRLSQGELDEIVRKAQRAQITRSEFILAACKQ